MKPSRHKPRKQPATTLSRAVRALKPVDLTALPVVTDAAVQTVWVDRMTLMLRADAPLVQLSFQTVVDGRALQVVCRLQTTTSHAHSMVDVLCRNLNYYPSRPPVAPPA